MIEVEFGIDDLARTRFAISPLWEVVASVRALKGAADARGPHGPWLEQVAPRLRSAKVDLSPLLDLVPVVERSPWSGRVPGFLCPPPTTPMPSIDAELATVRATPPELLRTTAAVPPDRLAWLRSDPAALDRLADTIAAYWELALAPWWPRIRALLESDIRYRADRLVAGGTQQLFADLDPQITWAAGTLHLEHRSVRGVRHLDGTGLLLVPSAFAWPRVFSVLNPPWQPSLRYPPRGVGTLWERRPVSAVGALAGVVGRSRALILAELTTPTSTTEMARRTALSPGGVSRHLTAMLAAGLVSAHRAGREVLYARTHTGEALVAAAES